MVINNVINILYESTISSPPNKKKQQVLVLEGLEKSAGKITFGAYYLYYKNRAVSVGSEFTNQDLGMYLFFTFLRSQEME